MSQHFLLSPASKTLSLARVFRMSDAEAETMFRNLRWPETNGARFVPIAIRSRLITAAARLALRASVAPIARKISA